MPESRSLSLPEDRAHELIEQAMMESARGRRFLAEFVRRHRSADTNRLLDAMSRLEQAVARDQVPTTHPGDALAARTSEAGDAGSAQMRSMRPSRPARSVPDVDLDMLAPAARRSTTDLLGEAENLQDTAWRLRESGAVAQLCSELEQCATRIYATCTTQEALTQRVESAVEILRRLEAQTSALQAREAVAAVRAPPLHDRGDEGQTIPDLERLRDLARRFRNVPAVPDANAALSLDDLDRLTVEERLALFS